MKKWVVFCLFLLSGSRLAQAVAIPACCFSPQCWQVYQDAKWVGTDIKLTDPLSFQQAAAWSKNKIDLTQDFDQTFELYFGTDDGGADGIAFVLQNDPRGLSTVGVAGGSIGYGGITPSLAVEIDTFKNGGEPATDHIGLSCNGVVSGTCPGGPAEVDAVAGGLDIENGVWHNFRVTWNAATDTMNLYFDGALRQTYTSDIINTVFGGVTSVYYGFTSATGGSVNLQQMRQLNCTINYNIVKTAASGATPVCVGQNTSYTLCVQNNGAAAMAATTMWDTLPSCLSYVSSVPARSNGPGNFVTWSFPAIAAGAQYCATVNVLVDFFPPCP